MTLSWYLSHPAETGLLVLTAVALAAAADYWLTERYNWRLDLTESLVGYGAGVIATAAGVYFLGFTRSVMLATAALMVTGAALFLFQVEPVSGGEPDGA